MVMLHASMSRRSCPSTIQSIGTLRRKDEENSQSTVEVTNLSKNKNSSALSEETLELVEEDRRDDSRSVKSKKKRSKAKYKDHSYLHALDVIVGDFWDRLEEVTLCGMDTTTRSPDKKSRRNSSKRASKKKKTKTKKKHTRGDPLALTIAATDSHDESNAGEEPPASAPPEFEKRPVLRSPPKQKTVSIMKPKDLKPPQTQDEMSEDEGEANAQKGNWEDVFLDQFGYNDFDGFGPSFSEDSGVNEGIENTESTDSTSKTIDRVTHLELRNQRQAMERKYIQEELEELTAMVETHTTALPDPRLCVYALLKKMQLQRKREEHSHYLKRADKQANPNLGAESLPITLQRESVEGKESRMDDSEGAGSLDYFDFEELSPAELLLQKLGRQREAKMKPRLAANEENDYDDKPDPAILEKRQVRDDDGSASALFRMMKADLSIDASPRLPSCPEYDDEESRVESVDSMITGDSHDASDDQSFYSDPLPYGKRRSPHVSGSSGNAWWKLKKQEQRQNHPIVLRPRASCDSSVVTSPSSRGDDESMTSSYYESITGLPKSGKKKDKDRLKYYINGR